MESDREKWRPEKSDRKKKKYIRLAYQNSYYYVYNNQ